MSGIRISGLAVIGVAIGGLVPAAALAGPLEVSITGIRNEAGIIRCGLFASPAGFREPGKEVSEATGTISRGRASCSFKAVPDGTYALAVFHAERGERTMDIGLFGKPKQGVGFSRNPSITFGPPKFEAASFTVGKAPLKLDVSLKY